MATALLLNYCVSNRAIISSAFMHIAMGPGPVAIARLGPMQKKLSPVSSHNNGPSPFNYCVSNRAIISSAFIAMGPGPVAIARLGPIAINAEEIIVRFLT